MIKYIRKLLLCLFTVTLFTSCATTPTPVPPTALSWQNRQMVLNQIQQWQLTGKIGVQTPENAGSATLNWVESQQHHYTLSLVGPLGAGGVTLTGQPGLVTMDTADGKHYTAQTPEQLLTEQIGWDLPVSYLYYWIRGLPVPDLPSQTQFDTSHRLTWLVQQHIQVHYLSYTHVGMIDLPNKIFITSPLVKIKIIIYNWKL